MLWVMRLSQQPNQLTGVWVWEEGPRLGLTLGIYERRKQIIGKGILVRWPISELRYLREGARIAGRRRDQGYLG